MKRTWESFRRFRFDRFVEELYLFHATAEQQRRLQDPESPEFKRFILAAGQVFERVYIPQLRFAWALMHAPITGQDSSLQREINDLFKELDQYTGG